MYNYYNYHEPWALNAEFQHFIPKCNQTSFTLRTSLKEWDRGVKSRPKDRVKRGWLTLRKTVLAMKNVIYCKTNLTSNDIMRWIPNASIAIGAHRHIAIPAYRLYWLYFHKWSTII
jgi:hypothetical protein